GDVVHPDAVDVGELVPEGFLELGVVPGDGAVRGRVVRRGRGTGRGAGREQEGEQEGRRGAQRGAARAWSWTGEREHVHRVPYVGGCPVCEEAPEMARKVAVTATKSGCRACRTGRTPERGGKRRLRLVWTCSICADTLRLGLDLPARLTATPPHFTRSGSMRTRTKLYAAAVGLATTGALVLSSGGASGHG